MQPDGTHFIISSNLLQLQARPEPPEGATRMIRFFVDWVWVLWHFHLRKKAFNTGKAKMKPVQEIEDGFLRSGLFKYSRHPNWFFEQALWWGMYGYSVAASGQWINYSIMGAVLLTPLFQGSLWITEMMSSRKYPVHAPRESDLMKHFEQSLSDFKSAK